MDFFHLRVNLEKNDGIFDNFITEVRTDCLI